jgi:signal transduction histidine kinase/ActR/RegA family two-component response regulator
MKERPPGMRHPVPLSADHGFLPGWSRWRPRMQGMRLSTRLVLVIATCLLPTILLQIGMAWHQAQQRRAQLGDLVTQQAQLLAGNVDSIAEGARILLTAAAAFQPVRARDEGCAARLTRLLDGAPGFAFLAVVEADGRIGCSSEEALATEPAGGRWIADARQVRSFDAGRYATTAQHPSGILPFYLPLPPVDGPAGGKLVAALDLDWLAAHLQGLKRTRLPFLAQGVLTVADADGVVLARDIRHAEFVGQRFPAAALSLLHATVPGILRLRSMDGTDRLVGYTPPTADSHHLSAVVGVHEPELMGDMAGPLLRGGALLAAVSLLATVLTLLVARRFITVPTETLLAAARRWREGDLAARAPACGGGSEFAQIATACNEMAAALQRREEELRRHAEGLETAVDARTQELREANARLRSEINERRSTEAALLQAQKVQAVGQLAGGIAHDFNNVLQAVLGGVTLIRRRLHDTAGIERLAGMIEDSARRGQSITRRLLTFSRREELRAEPLELGELLHGLQEVLGATLGARIRVEVAAPSGLPRILADRGQLETVLVNLATNARDAMPAGGTLTLAATLDQAPGAGGAFVKLTVADTGEGMDAATLARAADPFFTTKPLGQGTGLGLAMARSFAQGSGGRLGLTSTPGKGTSVSLWLPVATAPVQPDASMQVATRSRTSRAGQAPRVLLVDDEAMVREVLAAQLAEMGFEVTPCENGAAALAVLDAGRCFDVLVSDLAMPGLDGVALIREAQRRKPGLPALLVTGYAGDAAALAVGSAVEGRFALMRKPVTGPELADRVASLLEIPSDGVRSSVAFAAPMRAEAS